MKPSDLAETISELIDVSPPMFVQGPPGVGKSDIIRQAAQSKGLPVIDIRAVLLDPVDLRGLPKVNGDNLAHWCPPAFLPHDPEWQGVIFLDELPQAAPLVQSACLQLTLDRQLGEYRLPEGARIIAAGNRVQDRAGAHRIITPLLNRFVHLEIEVSTGDWQKWAMANNIDPRVRSFINFKPDMLHKFDPKSNDCAFPTPRSWAFVSRCMNGGSAVYEVVAGCVGKGAASEFCAHAELYGKLPDPKDVFGAPDTHPVPENEPSVMCALSTALVDAFRNDHGLMRPLATFTARMPKEFAAMTFRDAGTIQVNGTKNAILQCQEARQWIGENHDLLLA